MTWRTEPVTYRDDVPVGWCHIAPRADIPRLAASKLIRPLDDVAVWWRPGCRAW